MTRLNAWTDLTALVGTRIYPMQVPQGAVLPAVTYQRISTIRAQDLRGSTGLADPRIQVDSWAESYTTAKAVAQEVRRALDGYASGDATALILSELDLLAQDGQRHRVSQDYSWWHTED